MSLETFGLREQPSPSTLALVGDWSGRGTHLGTPQMTEGGGSVGPRPGTRECSHPHPEGRGNTSVHGWMASLGHEYKALCTGLQAVKLAMFTEHQMELGACPSCL